jgi:hypothetical protein
MGMFQFLMGRNHLMRFPKNTRILGWQRNWIQITNQKESEHPEGGRQKSQQHNQTKPKRKGQQRKKKKMGWKRNVLLQKNKRQRRRNTLKPTGWSRSVDPQWNQFVNLWKNAGQLWRRKEPKQTG